MILFQIEENTRVLEKLGQTIGGDRSASVATPLGSSGGGHKSGRASVQEKWKMGAKKALLQWCRAQVTHSILVHSFHGDLDSPNCYTDTGRLKIMV